MLLLVDRLSSVFAQKMGRTGAVEFTPAARQALRRYRWPGNVRELQNELQRIGNNFYRVPFRTYWQIRTGETVEDPTAILDQLRGEPLSDAQVEATKEFARLTPGHWESGQEYEIARRVIAVFDEFFKALTKISEAV